jgi:hypothetical protein
MNWLLKLFKPRAKPVSVGTIIAKPIAPTCIITEFGLMPVMFGDLGKRGIMFGLN